MIECSVCHSTLELETVGGKTVSRAYDRHRHQVSSKTRFLNVALVVGDCILVGLQPILVFTTKVDGGFKFSPVSVNFLTEAVKVFFAIVMLLLQARHKKVGEKSLLSFSTIAQAARNNVLLAVPAFLYAINNYLKFIMQLYFNPATVKMLSNLKWEALALLLIGISVNQLRSLPEGTSALGLPVATGAYLYTLIFVTVPSLASVFNEYALKSQYDTSIYHQNLFLYGYGAIFNFLGIVITAMFKDTILKKYSSTVATIFTGLASAALFGHTLTMNFILGISIVFISMHQFFSPLSKVKDEPKNISLELVDSPKNKRSKDTSFIDMAAGANEDASHRAVNEEKAPLLPV
ncbi:CMP-sialic acid transporter 3 [Citrus sinensis]|nr:CMP-sialic acid transporter 3 [Citrus sinensis]